MAISSKRLLAKLGVTSPISSREAPSLPVNAKVMVTLVEEQLLLAEARVADDARAK